MFMAVEAHRKNEPEPDLFKKSNVTRWFQLKII